MRFVSFIFNKKIVPISCPLGLSVGLLKRWAMFPENIDNFVLSTYRCRNQSADKVCSYVPLICMCVDVRCDTNLTHASVWASPKVFYRTLYPAASPPSHIIQSVCLVAELFPRIWAYGQPCMCVLGSPTPPSSSCAYAWLLRPVLLFLMVQNATYCRGCRFSG